MCAFFLKTFIGNVHQPILTSLFADVASPGRFWGLAVPLILWSSPGLPPLPPGPLRLFYPFDFLLLGDFEHLELAACSSTWTTQRSR